MYRQNYPDDPGMHNTFNANQGYTRVTYQDNPSFCKRVRDSLVAILIGVALLGSATCLLFYNEGRAVQTARSLEEGLRTVVPLQTTEVVFDENNHKPVHLVGQLATRKELYDNTYGVQINAVKLRRTVEMFQWVEHEHTQKINEGERTRTETTYSYDTAWRSDIVRSSSFATPTGHHNPTSLAISPMVYQANEVTVGAFRLSQELVGKISDFKKYHPKVATADSLLHDNRFYHGKDPLRPEVGDLRVTFEYAGRTGSDGDVVSVIAKQRGEHLEGYQTDAGDVLELLYMGSFSAVQIFGNEQAQNSMLTWGLRIGGWLLMFIGFQCLTSIITTLVDWLPIVREIVSLGVTLMCASLSISLSLTVIAVGWIFYRPLLGVAILIAAATPFVLTKWCNGRRGEEGSRPSRYED